MCNLEGLGLGDPFTSFPLLVPLLYLIPTKNTPNLTFLLGVDRLTFQLMDQMGSVRDVYNQFDISYVK